MDFTVLLEPSQQFDFSRFQIFNDENTLQLTKIIGTDQFIRSQVPTSKSLVQFYLWNKKIYKYYIPKLDFLIYR